jgi:hypothetical protein
MKRILILLSFVIIMTQFVARSQTFYTINENSSPVFSTLIPDQAYVIKDNINYKLYYAGNDFASMNLAQSPDGITWTPYSANPVISDAQYHSDVKYYSTGFPGANSGTNPSLLTMNYRIWYQGLNQNSIEGWRYAESPDGINWYNHIPVSQFGIPVYSSATGVTYGIVDVIYTPGATNTGTDWTFRIYANVQWEVGIYGGKELVVMAFSSDGYNWTGYDPTLVGYATPVFTGTLDTSRFDCDHIGWFKVIKNSPTDWQAFYSGGKGSTYQALNGIGYATSTDGIQWTHRQTLLTTNDAVAWRNKSVWMPSVVKSGNNYELFFLGSADESDESWIWWKLGRAILTPVADPFAGINFVEYPGNPLYGGASEGADRAYQAYVIKIGAVYNMWYGDHINTRYVSSTYPDFHDVTFPGSKITVPNATQPYKFTVYYNPAGWTLGGTGYSQTLVAYYTDAADNFSTNPQVAVSDDGINWTYVGRTTGVVGYPWADGAYRLSVLYEGNNTWKGYADQGGAIIQYYTSTDGMNWTGQAWDILNDRNPSLLQPWEIGPGPQYPGEISPYVFKVNNTYVMTYSGGTTNNNQAIGIAYSGDGINFTKSSANPIFSIADGVAWRASRCYNAYIMLDDGLWRMYFQGTDAAGVYAIGMATPEVPLPVELVSFTATVASNAATLTWKTATEVNNYSFDVERRMVNNQSSTLKNWGKVGSVKGSGTSNSAHSYSYTDASVSSGTYAYRLKQIDNNGTYKYSSEAEVTVSVPKIFALNQNYPNPFNPTTTIRFTLAQDGFTTLKIYDMLGREVATLASGELKAGMVNTVTFNASKLSSGVYFSKLESNGIVQIKKLVLMK